MATKDCENDFPVRLPDNCDAFFFFLLFLSLLFIYFFTSVKSLSKPLSFSLSLLFQ